MCDRAAISGTLSIITADLTHLSEEYLWRCLAHLGSKPMSREKAQVRMASEAAEGISGNLYSLAIKCCIITRAGNGPMPIFPSLTFGLTIKNVCEYLLQQYLSLKLMLQYLPLCFLLLFFNLLLSVVTSPTSY